MNRWKGSRISWRWVNGIVISILLVVGSCVHDPFVDPKSLNEGQPSTPGCYQGTICFESNVLPIFVSSCARTDPNGGGCHDPGFHQGDYVLNTYNSIVREGIVPGNASASKLYQVLFGEDIMPPPDPNQPPLTAAQKDSIRVWISQGAKNTVKCNCSCDTTQFNYAAIIEPIMATNCVTCHRPGNTSGGIDLTTHANVAFQANNGKLVGSITHTVGYKAMPQYGKLVDCQIIQIKKWVADGALNN